MSTYKEFQGKTLDDAISEACEYYGVPRGKLEIEIVSDAKTGIFGLVGVKKATIRAARMHLADTVSTLLESEVASPPRTPVQESKSDARSHQPGKRKPAQSQELSSERASSGDGRDTGGKSRAARESEGEARQTGQARQTQKTGQTAAHGAGQPAAARSGAKPKEGRPFREPVPAPTHDDSGKDGRGPAAAEAGRDRGDGRGPTAAEAGRDRGDGRGRKGGPERGREKERGRERTKDVADKPHLADGDAAGRRGPGESDGLGAPMGRQDALKSGQDALAEPGLPAPSETHTADETGGDAFGQDSAREDFPDFDLENCDKDRLFSVVSAAVLRLVGPIVGNVPCDVSISGRRVRVCLDCGDASGLLVGRDGQTLASVEYLASRIIARQLGGAIRLQVDAGKYRERQDDKLKELALTLAARAKESKRPQSTRPLSAYQRRLVHLALEGDEAVVTRSKGEGAQRRVVILLKRDASAKADCPAFPTPQASENEPASAADPERTPSQEQ